MMASVSHRIIYESELNYGMIIVLHCLGPHALNGRVEDANEEFQGGTHPNIHPLSSFWSCILGGQISLDFEASHIVAKPTSSNCFMGLTANKVLLVRRLIKNRDNEAGPVIH